MALCNCSLTAEYPATYLHVNTDICLLVLAFFVERHAIHGEEGTASSLPFPHIGLGIGLAT